MPHCIKGSVFRKQHWEDKREKSPAPSEFPTMGLSDLENLILRKNWLEQGLCQGGAKHYHISLICVPCHCNATYNQRSDLKFHSNKKYHFCTTRGAVVANACKLEIFGEKPLAVHRVVKFRAYYAPRESKPIIKALESPAIAVKMLVSWNW